MKRGAGWYILEWEIEEEFRVSIFLPGPGVIIMDFRASTKVSQQYLHRTNYNTLSSTKSGGKSKAAFQYRGESITVCPYYQDICVPLPGRIKFGNGHSYFPGPKICRTFRLRMQSDLRPIETSAGCQPQET